VVEGERYIDIGDIDETIGHHWLTEAGQISKMPAALIKARKSFISTR